VSRNAEIGEPKAPGKSGKRADGLLAAQQFLLKVRKSDLVEIRVCGSVVADFMALEAPLSNQPVSVRVCVGPGDKKNGFEVRVGQLFQDRRVAIRRAQPNLVRHVGPVVEGQRNAATLGQSG
jgi:hypothetical protein